MNAVFFASIIDVVVVALFKNDGVNSKSMVYSLVAPPRRLAQVWPGGRVSSVGGSRR